MKIAITESAHRILNNSLNPDAFLRARIIAVRGVVIHLELIGPESKYWAEVLEDDKPFIAQYLDEPKGRQT